MQKVAHIPKWKYKNVSETVKCATFDKTISALTTSTKVLIPLSPLQIYNIRMYPTLFAFGMVNLFLLIIPQNQSQQTVDCKMLPIRISTR